MSTHVFEISGAFVVVAAAFAVLRIIYGLAAMQRHRQSGNFSKIIRKLKKIS